MARSSELPIVIAVKRVSEKLLNPRSFIPIVNDFKTLFYCLLHLHDILLAKW